jgi:hypothetical protein
LEVAVSLSGLVIGSGVRVEEIAQREATHWRRTCEACDDIGSDGDEVILVLRVI